MSWKAPFCMNGITVNSVIPPLSGVHEYQSLDAWKHAHAAVLTTLRATDPIAPRQRAIFDQLRRAVVSIEANVVEGYALGTAPQFRRQLRIALGSAAESACLVRMARELEYLDGERATAVQQSLTNTIGCLVGLIKVGVAHRR